MLDYVTDGTARMALGDLNYWLFLDLGKMFHGTRRQAGNERNKLIMITRVQLPYTREASTNTLEVASEPSMYQIQRSFASHQ